MPFRSDITDGPLVGLSLDFIPCDHVFAGIYDEEEAFLFIEAAIAGAFLDWPKGYWLPKAVWSEAFQRLESLRFDMRTGVHPKVILHKHVRKPQLLAADFRIHRRAIHALHAEFDSRGVHIPGGLVDQPWGGTDFHVRDPSGNEISFVQYRQTEPTNRGTWTRIHCQKQNVGRLKDFTTHFRDNGKITEVVKKIAGKSRRYCEIDAAVDDNVISFEAFK